MPLVSVVTPFYNTAPYLAECIESVLGQTYGSFEYILVDNCSTDGSSEIAERYSSTDSRIRLSRRPQLLPQLDNYNRALTQVSDSSKYCKLIQADDWLFPECLQLMVRVFEQSETIGLVSSYWLEGDTLCGSGYPIHESVLSGIECARWFLRTNTRIFGSQSTVMYRSSIVRERREFYDVGFYAADLEVCMEILRKWDFGFVTQVLSFTRRDNGGINSSLGTYMPYQLHGYIIVQRYAPAFLETSEAITVKQKSKRDYYGVLARAALRLRGPAFWRFQQAELKALPETIDWPYLLSQIAIVSLWVVSNPGKIVVHARNSLKQRERWTSLGARVKAFVPLRLRRRAAPRRQPPEGRMGDPRPSRESETPSFRPGAGLRQTHEDWGDRPDPGGADFKREKAQHIKTR
jgi:glycosyltransferase involved in cell wall biosynthesis